MLLASGFGWNGIQLVGQLLQIIFPYLFFITLVAFSGAILNAHQKFEIRL